MQSYLAVGTFGSKVVELVLEETDEVKTAKGSSKKAGSSIAGPKPSSPAAGSTEVITLIWCTQYPIYG